MRFIFMLALFAAVLGLAACSGGSNGNGEDQAATGGDEAQNDAHSGQADTQTPAADEEDNPILERSLKKDPGPADEQLLIKTNMGDILLRLYPTQAPLAVSNFKGLASKGYYDGIIFHRVIDGFMIQGGDPTGTGFSGESIWGEKFNDEFDPALRFNRAGLLAMANSGPATNGSQFFITQASTPHLNDKHTIFGEVVEGMDVVNAIATVRADAKSKPVEPVVMESVTIVKSGD